MALSFALLAACGGGSGSSATASGGDVATSAAPAATVVASGSPEVPAATPVAHLSGSIVKGPVTGAQVCVYELIATGKGKQLGCTTSRADGSYALSLEFAGEVVVEAVGGTYTDEATGLAGVPLSAPLISATKLGGGPSILHTTPLTALAYNQAIATGSGGLSLANFEAKASLVKDAFGLGADVDLVRTLPTVATGATNPYGAALLGVSKMLGLGATLAGVVANSNIDALKRGLVQAKQCSATNTATALPNASTGVGGINWDDSTANTLPGEVVFTVTSPTAAWRNLLPTSGSAMGCQVSQNSADQVILTCPTSALQSGVALWAGTASTDANTLASLPANGVVVMGHFIHALGPLQMSGEMNFQTGPTGTLQLGTTVGGTVSILCGATALTASGMLLSEGVLNVAPGASNVQMGALGGANAVSVSSVLPLPYVSSWINSSPSSGGVITINQPAASIAVLNQALASGTVMLSGTLVTSGGALTVTTSGLQNLSNSTSGFTGTLTLTGH